MLKIGAYSLGSPTVLAPMAGISDQPFRALCTKFGAGMVVSEMLTSDTRLWSSRKSRTRLSDGNNTSNKLSPRVIQIAGSEPNQLAAAAQACVAEGTQIVDINMGCPAKKVCNRAAGSALLQDEALVADILRKVVLAVDVPVTVKIRTGWDEAHRNGTTIARIAEDAGIQGLTVHGRTRACRFRGQAEYDTIADIVQQVSIPVIANGDITSPQKAKAVLAYTGAAAIMIGRAAQGNPWIFRQINHYLSSNEALDAPRLAEIEQTILEHLSHLHGFYGEYQGVRIARKHFAWYLAKHISPPAAELATQARKNFNTLISQQQQIDAVRQFFDRLYQLEDLAA